MVQSSNRRSYDPLSGPGRARRRADARRVEILKAAARVFRDRGFAAAGMRHIAEAADLSPGNLYHYFRGKDELLFFCQDRSLDRLLDALATAHRGRAPLAARLRDLAMTHVLCLVDQVEGSAAHLEVDALPSRLRTAIVSKRDRYERGVRALVAAGIRSGRIRVADPTIATRAFLGALNWTAHWFRPDGSQSPQDIAEQVAAYAVAGLTGPVTSRQSPVTSPRSPVPSPKASVSSPKSPASSHAKKHAHRTDRQRRTGRGRVRSVQNAPRGAA